MDMSTSTIVRPSELNVTGIAIVLPGVALADPTVMDGFA